MISSARSLRIMLPACAMAILAACAQPQPYRSASQVNAFKRAHPCPSTHQLRGSCPGYVVDHIEPLACGGPDTPSNMQWQTVPEAKAKDRWERKGCTQRAR